MKDATTKAQKIEISVPHSDIENLVLLNRSDMVFAVIYGSLFLLGFILTLASI